MPIFASNFTANSLQGTVTVSGGQANVVLPISNFAFEGSKSFVIDLRKEGYSGTVIATSNTISIPDTTTIVSLTANISTVAEGNAILYTLTTTNVVNGTNVFFSTNSIVTANVNSNDFVGGNTGVITINNNVGTLTLVANSDSSLFDETTEAFTLQIRTGNATGNVVITSSNVTVLDTSNQYNVLSFVESASSATEGGTLTLTANVINIPAGTLLYYDTTGNVTTSNFTGGNTGSFRMNSVSNTISLVTTSSVPYGTSVDFRVRIRRDSVTGTVLATSNSLIINDAALTLFNATGGNVTILPGYKLHTYNTSGTFNVTSIGTTSGNIEYLVVAGGGAGGQNKTIIGWPGGGGGGGGYRTNVPGSTSGGGAGREANLAVASSTTYTVTVGAGATAITGGVSPQGSPSEITLSGGSFSNVISTGGGSGQNWVGPGPSLPSQFYGGGPGGSGGGGQVYVSFSPTVAYGSGTPGQGYPGNYFNPLNPARSGGGGGAGSGGTNDPGSHYGGSGQQSNITGTFTYYAGGGGGGGSASPPTDGGAGGSGGGGRGAWYGGGNPFTSGTVNTGGGGGGGDGLNAQPPAYTPSPGGSGGSGIVFIRYPWTGQYFTTLTTSTPNVLNGGNATFNLSVLNANGTTLYYSTDGNVTSSNFIGGNSGSFVANTTGATITLQTNNNIATDTTRNFTLLVRQDSVTGPVSITGGNVILYPYSANVLATGGNQIVDSGGYRHHIFLSSNTFNVTGVASPGTVEVFAVGGGGGGGGGPAGYPYMGGGGGAGGYLISNISIGLGQTSVVVGAGATAQQGSTGNRGANTSMGSIIAIGGGGGGVGSSSSGGAGTPGGSGGGGGTPNGAGGTGTPGQGNPGATLVNNTNPAGGGGASETGHWAGEPPSNGLNGGPVVGTTWGGAGSRLTWGIPSSYGTGVPGNHTSYYPAAPGRWFAGGGGGAGGIGGGSTDPGAGAPRDGGVNTGGGGGPGYALPANPGIPQLFAGGGGSGIVIIRYPY